MLQQIGSIVHLSGSQQVCVPVTRNANEKSATSLSGHPGILVKCIQVGAKEKAPSRKPSTQETRTRGCGGATKRWRRPMVLNRRYARLRLASACTTKGLRCMKGRRSIICSSAAAGNDLHSKHYKVTWPIAPSTCNRAGGAQRLVWRCHFLSK